MKVTHDIDINASADVHLIGKPSIQELDSVFSRNPLPPQPNNAEWHLSISPAIHLSKNPTAQ